MNRGSFLAMAASAALGQSIIGRANAAPENSKQPNFVFFLVDDLGWTDPACFGSSFYETPNVDRLRARGMKFTNAYAACPVCSPTRASIMTGKYPTRVGITDYINPPGNNQPEKWKRNTKMLPAPYSDRLAHEETTLAETFKEAGYATFFAGKWHLGPEGFWPEDQGFDINMGGIEKGGPYGGKRYFSPYGNPRLPDGSPGEHLPDRLATETVKFIEANRGKPFLAYLSFYSIHIPLMAREDLKKKYQKKSKGIERTRPTWGMEGARKLRMVQDHPVYAGMVEAMDLAVGKVTDALERLGLAENTIVIFMSDNGGLCTSEGHPTSNLPLRAGKGWLYEGGIREPMCVVWPGVVKAGTECDAPVISTDFYPTMLEMASLPAKSEQHKDGVSLTPLLKGEKSLDRDALYWHYPHYSNQGGGPGGAVRSGDWKLIEWYEDGRLELYNLASDVGENQNVVDQHPEIVKELRAKLASWRTSTGARMPTPNPRYKQ